MVRFAPPILREFEQPRGFQRFRWVHKCTTPHGAIRPIPNGANWLLVVYSPLNPPPQEPKSRARNPKVVELHEVTKTATLPWRSWRSRGNPETSIQILAELGAHPESEAGVDKAVAANSAG